MTRLRIRRVVAALAAACLLPAGLARAECKLALIVTIPVTMVGMQPTVTAKVNGKDATFVIDSGAFFSTIGPEAAKRLGLKSAYSAGQIHGVGGFASASVARAGIFEFAGVPIPNLSFLVAPFGDDRIDGLIGENFLGLRDVEYDLANGVVRLFNPQGCANADLAYWAKGQAAQMPLAHTARLPDSQSDADRHVTARAAINGKGITLTFDSGSYRSILTQSAAARAGVTPSTEGAVSVGAVSGFGPRKIQVWRAPFDSFSFGGENIQHTTLEFGDIELPGSDMLLGADFFLSHRIYVANSQRMVYLTYNGGPVFRFGAGAAAALAGTAPAADGGDINTPKDADGYRRRGAAFASRQDDTHAIADFTKAIELEPGNAQAYYSRAMARLRAKERPLAQADLDEAIKRDPAHRDARLARGALYLGQKAVDKAMVDFEAAVAADSPGGLTALHVAEAFERAERFADALPFYDRWLAANPKRPETGLALNGRCWVRAVLKQDLDQALADCNAAVKLNALPGYLDSRGLVHMDRGELDLAIADYDAAVKLQPKAAMTLYARGVAKLNKGLKESGRIDVETAVALEPRVADEARRFGIAAAASPPGGPSARP